MKKLIALMAASLLTLSLAEAGGTNKSEWAKDKESCAVYSCETCNMDFKEPGKCPMDGTELKGGHLMKGKDGQKYVCPCSANCDCTMKEGDATTCTCDKPARKANFMGAKKDSAAMGESKKETSEKND